MPEDDIVFLFDMWMTLVYGLTTDPILTTRQILSGNPTCGPDADFFKTCLTSNIHRPARFLRTVAHRHGYASDADKEAAFRKLLRDERRAATLYDDALPTLAALRARGIRLGLISNLWPFPVKQVIERKGLAREFEHLVYSFAVGYRKPAAEIFLEACRLFGVRPDQCTMIGDSVSSDIEGALAVGMKAVLVHRYGTLPAARPGLTVVKSLSELVA